MTEETINSSNTRRAVVKQYKNFFEISRYRMTPRGGWHFEPKGFNVSRFKRLQTAQKHGARWINEVPN